MIKKSIIVFIIVINYCILALQAQENYNHALISRGSLNNLSHKLKSENSDSLTIAFIGGSITEAKDGWRDQTMDWFQKHYPQQNIKQINAGIGGTGSSLGVYRINEQVLQNNPDLVFIEFAVNDYKE